MSYNWDKDCDNLWWTIRSYGFDPEDTNLKNLLEDVFKLGYERCIAEYGHENL